FHSAAKGAFFGRPQREPAAHSAGGNALQGAFYLFDKEALRLAVHFHQRCALLALFAAFRRTLLWPRNGNPAFLRHDAQGFGELALFHLHHKTENVTAFPATEAVIDLTSRMDIKRRRFLRMKRTQSPKALSRFSKLDVLTHYADDIRLLFHLVRDRKSVV